MLARASAHPTSGTLLRGRIELGFVWLAGWWVENPPYGYGDVCDGSWFGMRWRVRARPSALIKTHSGYTDL